MTRSHLLGSLRTCFSRTFLLVALTPGAHLPAAERPESVPANDLRITPVSDPNVIGVSRPPSRVTAPQRESIINESGSADWRTNYADALKQAAREKKRVLLNFTGSDWCGWCIRLEADVFSKPEFKEYAAQHLILVRLDFPRKTRLPAAEAAQNSRLQQQFGVRGFPTLVAVDASGTKRAQITGYVRGGPKAFIAALERQMGR